MTKTLMMRLSAVALIGAGLSGCAALGTTVAEDDPETEVQNVSLGRAVMEGLGAVPSRRTPINYQPRAPLVVPPTTAALAPPESPNQIASLENWPKDPEVETRERLREAAAYEAQYEDGDPRAVRDIRLPPRPAVLEKEFDPQAEARRIEMPRGSVADASGVYDRDGNPRRRALVEPPVAYLQPAPGAPVAIPEEKKDERGFFQRLKFW